jgi:hypothetical protein
MVGRTKKRAPPKKRGLPNQDVSPPRQRESPLPRRSPRRTNSPQAGNDWDFGNINVSPNDQSLESKANLDVGSDLIEPGLVADHFENDNENVTEDKLHSSTATNSKTSMADSSRHPNDAGKKAATTDDSSSSDKSSSSDDSDDVARSAPTRPRGKILAFQSRFGQGKQLRLGAPSADESSEDSSDLSVVDRKDSAHSATTTGRGKILAGKNLRRLLPTAQTRSTKTAPRDVGQCIYFDVFSTYARQTLPSAEEFDEIMAAVKSVTINVTSQRSGSTNRMSQLNSEVSSWNTNSHHPAQFTMIVLVKMVFPLNQHMMSELIILIISKPLLLIQSYCNTHYQAMKI